jgi:hypothetical protein
MMEFLVAGHEIQRKEIVSDSLWNCGGRFGQRLEFIDYPRRSPISPMEGPGPSNIIESGLCCSVQSA